MHNCVAYYSVIRGLEKVLWLYIKTRSYLAESVVLLKTALTSLRTIYLSLKTLWILAPLYCMNYISISSVFFYLTLYCRNYFRSSLRYHIIVIHRLRSWYYNPHIYVVPVITIWLKINVRPSLTPKLLKYSAGCCC